MTALHVDEFEWSRGVLSALESVPGLRRYRLTDMRCREEHVATFSCGLKDIPPRVAAEKLAREGKYVWEGK